MRPLIPSALAALAAFALLLPAPAARAQTPPMPPASPGCDVARGSALPPGFAYPAGDTVRVATWNAEHFVDGHDSPYVRAAREDAPDTTRLAAFARSLRALDADVVVLQEFESAAFARAFASARLPDMGYRFVSGHESTDWYQNVVVLSRLPLGVLRSYANVWTPVEGVTDSAGVAVADNLTNHRLWAVDVLARPGYAFALVGAHLKAGRSARDTGWRTGQVRLLHAEFARLAAACPDANVLVAGDLNAIPGSAEIVLLENADGALSPVRFTNPLAGALTHPADAPTRQLDYLLPSASMLPELVPGSARVGRAGADARAVSDHLPVVAAFVARGR